MRSKVTIIVFLSFLLILAGCGSKASKDENYAANNETTEWKVSHRELDKSLDKAVFYENSIFGATEEEGGITVTEYDLTSMSKKQEFFIDSVDSVSSISVKENGNIVVLGQKGEDYSLLEISGDGAIDEINDIQIEKMGLWPEMKGVFFSDDGYCFIWYRMTVPCTDVFEDGEVDVYTPVDRIYVKNADMETISYDEIPDSYGISMIGLMFDKEGHPFFLAQDDDGYYEKNIRLSVGKEEEIERLDSNLDSLRNVNNLIKSEKGFIYTSKGDICSFSMETETEERLFHLATAGLSETDIVSWQMDDGEIKIVDNYSDGENTEVTTICEGKSDKTVLRIAMMYLDESYRDLISSFNRYSNTIQLEPVVYAENYDFDGGIEKLELDIVQGKAPDLFFTNGMDYEMLSSKGAFENLNDYIKKDSDLTENEIVKSVFDAYEVDENLYEIGPTFIIHTMWGGQNTVKDISGINFDELTEFLSAKGKNINNIYGLSTGDESALMALTSMEMDSFIDWNEGICNFECEEFYNLLKIVKSYEGANIGGSLYNAIRSEDVIFSFGTITSVEDYCLQCELYGEKINFIGYPTDSGFGSAISLTDSVAINSKSENKEAAWEFIKYYVINGEITGFPVYVPKFEKMLSDSLEFEYFDDGETSEKMAKAAYSEPEVISLYVYSADTEDVEAVRRLVENTNKKYEYETDIQTIIEEEVAAFLQDQKSEQETAEIIQSRVSLFMAEKE